MFGKKRPDLSSRNKCRVWTKDAKINAAKKASGVRPSEETRRKMSAARKGKSGPNKGKKNLGVSIANKSRSGTEAAKLAAKRASMVRWGKLHSVGNLTE